MNFEKAWQELANLPINQKQEIEKPFYHFDKGTNLMDVWQWVDENSSNGIAHLMGSI